MSMGDVAEALTRQVNTPEFTEARILRLITDVYMPRVSAPEFKVLMFVFRRTWMYGKPSERIPMRHFMEGVWSGDEMVHPGLGMGRTQVYAAINSLVENVIILRQQDDHNSTPAYSINPIGPSQVFGKPDTSVRKTGRGCPENRTHKYKNNKKENPNSSARAREASSESVNDMAHPMDAARAAVAAATQKHIDARTKKKTKGNVSAYQTMWQDAFHEAYPTERWFPWTIAQGSAFKKALDRGVPDADREAFINFVVYKFTDVMSGRFSWMTRPPAMPVVGFVTKNVQEFWQAFEDERDPNRQLRRRVQAGGSKPVAVDQKIVDAKDNEIAALRKRNAELEAKATTERQNTAVEKQRKVRKLLLPKKRSQVGGDDEFKWRDD